MKLSHFTSAAALTLALASNASAQVAQTVSPANSFGVMAGATVPTGDLGNIVNTGYHVGLLYAMHSPTTPMGFRLEGQFHEMNWQNGFTPNAKHRILAGIGDITYDLGASSSGGLYVIGGLGYYGTYDVAGSNTNDKVWSWGVNGGAGYRMALSGMNAFVEARYHALLNNDDKEHFIPISFGITF